MERGEWAWVACAVLAAIASWFVPQLVARIPEPPEDPDRDPDAEPKPLYVDLAATPALAWKSAAWGAIAGGLIGWSLGWAWPLLYLLPLVPISIALAFVDYRIRLLPTKVIAPTYLLVIVAVVVCTAVTGDVDALGRAALGWLAAGLVFFFLWRFTNGMGYGDVRLSGVLGIALGFLGWAELVVGLYAGFLLGAVGWIPLRLLRITKDRNFPFGPFMLVGALVGVLWGADLGGLANGQG